MNERKCVVITDLDNTLFDWFEAWYQSFNAMLLCLVEKSELPRETLVQEIKTIHQIHGTSEYAFVIESIPSIQARFPNEDLVQRFDECIHAHSKMRKKHLHLYPGVRDTLRWLKGRNCQIVAYTESMAFYTNRRVR